MVRVNWKETSVEVPNITALYKAIIVIFTCELTKPQVVISQKLTSSTKNGTKTRDMDFCGFPVACFALSRHVHIAGDSLEFGLFTKCSPHKSFSRHGSAFMQKP